MADGSITINTSIDDSGIKKGTKNIENGFSKLKSTVTKTIAAIGVGNLVKDFVSTGIQYNAEIEKYQTALTTLTGSAEEANKVIKQIKEDAAKTPFDVAGLTQANQLLISTGLSADDSRETILALGNAISATGGGNEELSRMAVNLQQIKNTGKAAAIDIKQFAFAGIDIYGLLADYLGITKQEAAEMEVSWENLNGALINASKEGGKYFGAMTNQSATLNGQWSTLKDNFKEFTGKALQPLTNLLKDNLLPILNDIITGGENIKKWIKENSTLITILVTIISSLTAAIIANTIAKNADIIVIWLYVTATNAAALATTAFSTVLTFLTSPITLVILAIGAIIAIVVLLVKNWDTVKEKTIEIWNKIKDSLSTIIANIIDWFKNLPYNIGKYIGEMLGHIIQFGTDAKNWVTTELPKIINNIINWFKELPGKIATWLTNTIQKIGQWIDNMKNKVVQGIPQVINNIINFFKQLPQNMSNIGRNIIEGLWKGIQNAVGWIKDKIAGFAKGILDGMKSALGIHSPSRVFRDEVGKYIALGVGEGFSKNIDSVYKKMKSTVDFETQKLNANLTSSSIINVERNANIQSRLESIDNNKEIQVNSTLNLDGKVVANVVNKVNAKQKLQYGIA